MARVFVKPLVLACTPEYYESLVSPIVGPLFTYLHMVSSRSGKGSKEASWSGWPLMSPTDQGFLKG